MKINEKVVCVKSHEGGAVRKGRIYTILGIDDCPCGAVAFDVGVVFDPHIFTLACSCGKRTKDGIWWIRSKLFAPIVEDEFLNSDEIDKIVEEKIDIEIPVEA